MARPKLSAVITGAAGGIALATIKALSNRYDGKLFLLDIDESGLNEVRENYTRPNLDVTTYKVDLCENGAVEHAFADIEAQAGKIDFLFANAGIMTSPDRFEATSIGEIDRSISLNFRAVVSSVRYAWSSLSEAQGCVVINASGAGRRPLASDVVYSASKAAAIMFARANALRHCETGIRFNVVCPGVVDTPILNDRCTGEWRQEVHDFVKVFKLIRPEEIAECVLEILAHNESNGEVQVVENKPV